MAKDTQILTYAREGGVGLDIDRCIKINEKYKEIFGQFSKANS